MDLHRLLEEQPLISSLVKILWRCGKSIAIHFIIILRISVAHQHDLKEEAERKSKENIASRCGMP